MSTNIGAIGSFRTRTFSDSITRPSNTTAYTAGDVISEVTTNDHFTFGAASDDGSKRVTRVGVNSGVINWARLHSSANQSTKLDCELLLFHADIAEVADNAAFAPTDAELATRVAVVDFPASFWKEGDADSGADGNALCEAMNLDIPFRALRHLYGQLVARNGYTPISGEQFVVELGITQD